MSLPIIRKEMNNYINPNVFINHLNVPMFDYVESVPDFLQEICDKLDSLMKVPHQEFWCHIIYDTSILKSLQSFCSNAKRPYEMALENCQFSNKEMELYKKYYLLILRMISNKEANIPESFVRNFGQLIYDNFIVDIPLLFDICSIFGDENPQIISKLIMFILSSQPEYLNDFKQYATESVKFIEEIVSSIYTKKKINPPMKKMENSEQKTNEILHHIIDFSYGWNVILEAVRMKREIFTNLFNISFHKSLEKLFEATVPFMQEKIDKFETSDPEKLKKLLSVECFYLIKVWRQIFVGNFLDQLFEKSSFVSARSSEENFSYISECVAVIGSCQENPIFADAMYLVYPIQNDFSIISQAVKNDKEEYYSSFIEESMTQIMHDIESRQTIFSLTSSTGNKLHSLNVNVDFPKTETFDQNIKQVREIFPDLLERHITAYLETYNCKTEDLLDALLNGAIDVDFIKKTLVPHKNDQVLAKKTELTSNYQSILNKHHNIYDGDDLDTGRVNASQLHIGKRQTELESRIDPNLRNMILAIVCKQDEEEEENVALNTAGNTTYDDEFDDVYGISHDGNVVDNNDSEEVFIEKPRVIVEKSNDFPHKPSKAFRMTNNAKEPNKSASKLVTENIVADTDNDPTLMEPSRVKFSNYDKRQFKKKQYQDGPSHVVNGNTSSISNHRQGSHASKETTNYKKDHRPKGERNNKFVD